MKTTFETVSGMPRVSITRLCSVDPAAGGADQYKATLNLEKIGNFLVSGPTVYNLAYGVGDTADAAVQNMLKDLDGATAGIESAVKRFRKAEGKSDEVGCVVADIEDAVAQAEKDEALTAALLDACKKLLWKCRCRGTGKYVTECTLCGDSTWDHHCNDEERECSDEACAAARKLISEAEVRG